MLFFYNLYSIIFFICYGKLYFIGGNMYDIIFECYEFLFNLWIIGKVFESDVLEVRGCLAVVIF